MPIFACVVVAGWSCSVPISVSFLCQLQGSKKGVAFIRDKWDALFPVKDGEDSQKYGPEPTAQVTLRTSSSARNLDFHVWLFAHTDGTAETSP